MTLRDKRVTGAYGDMRFKQGVANIVLKHEESIAAKGLPSGIRYTVEDTDNNKAYKVEKSGETGIIKEGELSGIVISILTVLKKENKICKLLLKGEKEYEKKIIKPAAMFSYVLRSYPSGDNDSFRFSREWSVRTS